MVEQQTHESADDAATSDSEPISPETLAVLAEDVADRRLRETLLELSKRIAAGEPPEEAAAALSAQAPTALRGFVAAGVRTGRLTEMLEYYLRQQAASRRLWRELWATIAYPLFVLLLLTIIILFALAVIAPMFVDVLVDFDFKIDLPFSTRTLMAASREASELVTSPWLPATLVALLSIPWLLRAFFGRPAADALKQGVPIVGPLWSWSCLGEFARTLSLLIRYQVQLPEALRITGAAMSDQKLGQACVRMSEGLEEGRPLAELIDASPQFPTALAPLASWGMRHDSLSDALDIVGRMCDEQARLRCEWLKTTLPPFVFLVVLSFVIYGMSVLLMPMLKIIVSLSSF